MVYYCSRRYEQLTHTVQLFNAVVVAVLHQQVAQHTHSTSYQHLPYTGFKYAADDGKQYSHTHTLTTSHTPSAAFPILSHPRGRTIDIAHHLAPRIVPRGRGRALEAGFVGKAQGEVDIEKTMSLCLCGPVKRSVKLFAASVNPKAMVGLSLQSE